MYHMSSMWPLSQPIYFCMIRALLNKEIPRFFKQGDNVARESEAMFFRKSLLTDMDVNMDFLTDA